MVVHFLLRFTVARGEDMFGYQRVVEGDGVQFFQTAYTCTSKLCTLTQINHVSMEFKDLGLEKKLRQAPSPHDELFLVLWEGGEGVCEVVVTGVQWSMFSKNLGKVPGKIENRHSRKMKAIPLYLMYHIRKHFHNEIKVNYGILHKAKFHRTSIYNRPWEVSSFSDSLASSLFCFQSNVDWIIPH